VGVLTEDTDQNRSQDAVVALAIASGELAVTRAAAAGSGDASCVVVFESKKESPRPVTVARLWPLASVTLLVTTLMRWPAPPHRPLSLSETLC